MSGGHFNYSQGHIQNIIERIEQIILEPVEYNKLSDKTIEEFKVALTTLHKAYVYAQRIDWLLSGDDGEESFHQRLKQDLDSLEK